MSQEAGGLSIETVNNQTDVKDLVMSIMQGEQDYERLLAWLEPATLEQKGLSADTALTLALLLEDVEQQAELNDQLRALVQDDGAPAMVLSETGVILARNPAAASLFAVTEGESVLGMGVRRAEFDAFQQRIVKHEGPSLLRTFPDVNQSMPVMFIGFYQAQHQIFLLRAIECQWSESIDHALEDIFQLTEAERAILACLAQGMTSEQISQQRNSTVGTVRQQIKTVLNKLGATSQVQAAALASALASQPQTSAVEHAQPAHLSSNPLNLGESVRETRRIGWRRFGKPGGRPVLCFHGAYFGAGEFEQERDWARREGLDVLIVERPGYGRTQPPGKKDELLQTQIQDCLAILDQLGWNKVSLLSHDFGFVPALAFADKRPQQVQGLFAVSPPVPYDNHDTLDPVPRNQRMFIWSARHAFWMIRLLLRLGQVKARKYGPEKWMEMVFEGAPHELPFFDTASGKKVSVASYAFNLNQHSKGHELDMLHTVATDWTPLLRRISVPVQAVAGSCNSTFPLAHTQRLTEMNPALRLDTIEGAGLTLCLTHIDDYFGKWMSMMEGEG